MSCPFNLWRVAINGHDSVLPKSFRCRVKYDAIIFSHCEELEASNVARMVFSESVPISCGQCLSCRVARSKEWTTRIMIEAMQYPHNYFVTLTYDEAHVPRGDFMYSDGRVEEGQTNLCKSDVQAFMKRLLSNAQYRYKHQGIRRFICGEYGSQTDRAHYHIALFNMPDLSEELNVLRKRSGVTLYRSKLIEDSWKDKLGLSYGISSVGELNYTTASYIARYCVKKLTEPVKVTRELEEYIKTSELPYSIRQPEFILPSRNPGLARDYFEQHRDDIYTYDKLVMQMKDHKALALKPPKYFDYLFDLDSPDKMKKIKQARKDAALASEEYRKSISDLTYEEYQLVKERALERRLERAPRCEI